MKEINAVLAIAARDVSKLFRDRPRLIFSVIFPMLMVGLLGGTLQSNLGRAAGFNFIGFTFTGILGLTLFQSSAQGLISLIEDRENDFSQEMFVSPISRYSIVFGKIAGETGVAFLQALPTFGLAIVLGVHLTLPKLGLLLIVSVAACLLGGAFGVVALSVFSNQRAAQSVFPFLVFPQFFLAGIFNPIKVLPWFLLPFSLIAPLRWVVDLLRAILYSGTPEYPRVVLSDPFTDAMVIIGMFLVFITVGTALFVRQETNR